MEDNKINPFLTESILEKSGYKIKITNNGQEAIDLINSYDKSFDLILMDLLMPIMDGYESADYIKNILKLNTPIIALTADVQSNVLFEKEKDFNAYLKKPFRDEEIITLIRTFFELMFFTVSPKSQRCFIMAFGPKNTCRNRFLFFLLTPTGSLTKSLKFTQKRPELCSSLFIFLESDPSTKAGYSKAKLPIIYLLLCFLQNQLLQQVHL